ncbi:MAG: CGNR zinc finger domain-containing protein [Rubrobacter sp.]|nr:CGNR zinc finger domain-containing protein [Rubrobacter sp.]
MAKGKRRTKSAPGDLRLVQEFVNTKNLMRGYDLLESPESAGRWLAESGFEVSEETLSQEKLGLLRDLRENMREILLSHNRGASADVGRSVFELNRIVGSVALGVHFDPSGEPSLESSSTGVESLTEDLLAAAIRARHTGVWQRLKACANEECCWVFYDGSKNRSGSWCVMGICGSRAKMRAYRQRQSGSSRNSA